MFVKICGVTTVDDALLAAGLGADAVGMIFAASARRVSQGEARDIVRRLPPEVIPVGVFRNEGRERVAELANTIGLRAVQLHGHESPEDTRWVADRVPIVIRAFAATDPALTRAQDYGPVWLLVDSATPGSGQVFDWAVLECAPLDRPFILAGGLHPGNVADAVDAVDPWGIDVASGVEASPGRKDPARLRQFLANARRAAARAERSAPARSGLVPGAGPGMAWPRALSEGPGPRPGHGPNDDLPFNWEEDGTWR